MIGQINMFDLTMPMISITNKIRLIELFAGYGSQAMALDEMGVNYEHYKVVEFDKYAIRSYNAVHGTCFEPSDIRDIHGNDLEILYTDLFTYLLTYSFPCTDLSVAGKMQGMSKGSGTRSGLLWEVERLLTEIHDDGGELPQILFMENVPQVLSSANIKDFHAWQDFLTGLGYTNHVQVLNAKDYGVAQNRERAFMFSLLGEYNYKFPEPIPLTKTIKDYLEEEVDEKYYINTEKAQRLIEKLIESGDLQGCVGNVNPSGNGSNGNAYSGDLTPTLTTNKGEGQKIVEVNQVGNIADEKNFENPQTGRVYDTNGIAPTLNTCGGGGHEPKIIELGRLNSSQDGIVVDSNGISATLTSGHGNTPKTIVAMRGRNPQNPSDRTTGAPTEQRLEPNSQGLCNTLTSVQKDNLVLENSVLGTLYSGASEKFGCGYMPDICKTLKANKDDTSILIKQATKDGYIDCKIDHLGIGHHPFSKKQEFNGYGDISPCLIATDYKAPKTCMEKEKTEKYGCRYRIRKLTPRECGRLMFVSDTDITKMLAVVSNSQAYKQFGNSIVVLVMVAMFSNLNIQGLPRWDVIKQRYI